MHSVVHRSVLTINQSVTFIYKAKQPQLTESAVHWNQKRKLLILVAVWGQSFSRLTNRGYNK